jgi:hypothetical protein
MAGFSESGDETSGSGATDLIIIAAASDFTVVIPATDLS